MNSENSTLMLWGFIIFIVVGAIAFFVRNNVAKVDKDRQPEEPAKQEGSISIAKTRK